MSSILCGIFVGGAATRMGGIAKGLLPAPDTGEPLVARTLRLAQGLGLEVCLVGAAQAYQSAFSMLPVIADNPAGIGPLGGLGGLLAAAGERPALALACDLPFVSAELLERLAHERLSAQVLAPRSADIQRWEPLCARYDAASVRAELAAAIARGERSFQALFRGLCVEELTLSPAEQRCLLDWDKPEDLNR
jgi:molybdopterin-guanine dinucleotide biosynthesis protein A